MLTAQKMAPVSLPVRAARPVARNTVVCSVRKPEQPANLAQPVVAAVAAAMLMGAAMPDEALAARSGGRVGGTASRYMTIVPEGRVGDGFDVLLRGRHGGSAMEKSHGDLEAEGTSSVGLLLFAHKHHVPYTHRTSNAPAKSNNTTVINNTTVVAPPMFGGFGFGFGFPVFMPVCEWCC